MCLLWFHSLWSNFIEKGFIFKKDFEQKFNLVYNWFIYEYAANSNNVLENANIETRKQKKSPEKRLIKIVRRNKPQ